MLVTSVSEGNKLFWKKNKTGFYEVYFFKVADPLGQWSFWGRYTLLAPHLKKATSKEATASVWGIFSKKTASGYENTALKKTYLIDDIDLLHSDRFIQIEDNFLSLDSAYGSLASDTQNIAWDLQFEDPNISQALFPNFFFYALPFPKTKLLAPRWSTYVSGHLVVDHHTYRVEHVPAHQAHLWGSAYAHNWAWGHCNQFNEDSSAVFEGLSAQIPLGTHLSPPFNIFSFVINDEELRANTVFSLFKNKSSYDLHRWQFTATAVSKNLGALRLEGVLTRSTEEIIGVEYLGPNDEKRFCHNSSFCSMELSIFAKSKSGWQLYKKLTSNKAAFETVGPTLEESVSLSL